MSGKTVFVALSGGVDSSVAAYLLKQKGFDVVGVYFKNFNPLGDREFCKQAGASAQKVAETLNIPFKVYDLQKEYEQKVFDYMLKSYKQGITPNPDAFCNREIKFGVFAQRAFAEGAGKIATGHYARVLNIPFYKKGLLLSAFDKNKDQSYFLSLTDPTVFKRVIFPLGKLYKSEVRKLAKKAGLHTADKKDSQGLCFVGEKESLRGILQKFIKPHKGKLIDLSGQIIGEHDGAEFYTIGQRRGFSIFPEFQTPESRPLFVIDKNIKKNTVTVGTQEQLQEFYKTKRLIKISNINTFLDFKIPFKGKLRIRHRGELYEARVIKKTDSEALVLSCKPLFAPAVGQVATLYVGEFVWFAGVISEIRADNDLSIAR